jgi:hypothetical protein
MSQNDTLDGSRAESAAPAARGSGLRANALSAVVITEHGKPGRYPATVSGPAFQDQAVRTARDLARDAATAAGHRGRP